jgi:hypothetical protein
VRNETRSGVIDAVRIGGVPWGSFVPCSLTSEYANPRPASTPRTDANMPSYTANRRWFRVTYNGSAVTVHVSSAHAKRPRTFVRSRDPSTRAAGEAFRL